MPRMLTCASFMEQIASGVSFKYLFFSGHTPKRAGEVDASCLRQWFPAEFTIDGVVYPTAEHFMMAEKARLFHDDVACARVLDSKHPSCLGFALMDVRERL